MVVDDEPELRALLGEYFGRHGFEVRLAEDAAVARRLVAQGVPDLAILDVNMPGENGLSLARCLREAHPQLGLVMLTTAGESVDRIVGLELGADDYLPKPFEMRELLARVAFGDAPPGRRGGRTGRSTGGGGASPTRAACASASASSTSTSAACSAPHGAEVEISAAEYDLLALFARHPNRPLNRDQIMEQAHNRGWDVFDRSIDLRIMRLRRKIERNPDKPEVLKTVRNVGYVFVPGAGAGA